MTDVVALDLSEERLERFMHGLHTAIRKIGVNDVSTDYLSRYGAEGAASYQRAERKNALPHSNTKRRKS